VASQQTPALADRALRAALTRAELDDEVFDALYSPEVRRVAHRFWTPLGIAARAAGLLVHFGARRVLDAGAGPGKFCIAGGLAAPAIQFTGVEHRPHLVEEARRIASRLEMANACFVVGDLTRATLRDFDAAYFFNPFAENIYLDPREQFDATVELSKSRFRQDVLRIEEALAAADEGLLVVTYYGFGGRIPVSYDLLHGERAGTDCLRVWRKERAWGPAAYKLEDLLPLESPDASTAEEPG
jgi:SAM-dependent methyltransferase